MAVNGPARPATRRRRRRRPRPVWHPEIPEGLVAEVSDGRGKDLTIPHGDLVVLQGEPGSELVRALAGLDRPAGRTVELHGSVATVFREPRLLPWRTVQDNVALALLGTRFHAVRREKARRVLEQVGLDDRRAAWPSRLTPAEAARTALARALVSGPALLLLDDPFAALAPPDRIAFAWTVRRLWQRERPAVLAVTSDPAVAAALTREESENHPRGRRVVA